jgi:hypothetical protein
MAWYSLQSLSVSLSLSFSHFLGTAICLAASIPYELRHWQAGNGRLFAVDVRNLTIHVFGVREYSPAPQLTGISSSFVFCRFRGLWHVFSSIPAIPCCTVQRLVASLTCAGDMD